MGKRKIKILETAATAVAKVSWFIESQGLPQTAEQFVDDVFNYFETLADEIIEHRPCTHTR